MGRDSGIGHFVASADAKDVAETPNVKAVQVLFLPGIAFLSGPLTPAEKNHFQIDQGRPGCDVWSDNTSSVLLWPQVCDLH